MLSLLALLSLLTLLLVGTMLKPAFALVGVLSLFALDQWAILSHPILANRSWLINFFIAGLLGLAVLMELLRGRRARLSISAVWLLVLALYGYAYTSNLWAPYGPDRSWTLLPYLILYIFLAPLLVRELKDLQGITTGFLWVGPIVLVALLLFGEFGERGLVAQIDGVLEETPPLAIGQFSGLVVLGLTFLRVRGHEKTMALVRPLAVLLATLIILKTGSRGQLIGVVLSIILVWPMITRGNLVSRYSKTLVALASIAVLVWIAFEASGVSTYRWDPSQTGAGTWSSGMQARVGMWKLILDAWYSDPITILFGLGNSASFSGSLVGYYPHNVPIEVLAEEGVLGLSVYLATIALIYKSFRRLSNRFDDCPEAKGQFAFLFSVVVYNFILSTKQGALLGNDAMLMFFCGILIANLDQATSRARSVEFGAQSSFAQRRG